MLRAALAATLLAASVPAQQVVFDDFDRPNGTNMGPDWTEQNGDLAINVNMGRGNVPFANDTWMSHDTFAQPYEKAKARIEFRPTSGDVFFGTGFVLGLDPSTWSGVAVLLQDNDLDGLYDRLFFHAAINAGAWFSQGTPVWYDLPTPLAQGELTGWVQDGGDTAVVRVEDHLGALQGVYTATGIVGTPFAPTGTSAGVWVRSRSRFDDFWALERRALDAYPKQVSLSAGGTQTLDLHLETAHAGELYVVLGSVSGTSPGTPAGAFVLPLNTDAWLLQTLSSPGAPPYAGTFGFLDAVGHARGSITIPAGSTPSAAGLTVHHAAATLELATGTVSAVTNATEIELLP